MREYNEYSKIDIHQHFGGNHTFDRAIDDKYDKILHFDWIESCDILRDAYSYNFNLIAMTNQNVFDACKYLLLRKLFQLYNMELIPGIEINLYNDENKKYLHTIVLFNPNDDLISLQKEIENIIAQNQKNYFTVDNLVDFVLKKKVILIPHGIKQAKGEVSLTYNPSLVDLYFTLEDAFPVFIEDNQIYHKETLKEQLKGFIDVKQISWIDSVPSVSGGDRVKPSDIKSPTYIWGENSFDDLYYCALMNDGVDNPRVKRDTDIIKKIGYIQKIQIKKTSKTLIETTVLNCSHGLNAIIGSSGSGKTLLLSLINRKIMNTEIINKTIQKNYDEISNISDVKLFDENNKEIKLNDIAIFEGDNLYKKIIEAFDSDKDKLMKQFGVNIKFDKFNDIGNIFERKINEYINKKKSVNEYSAKIQKYLSNIFSTVEFLKQNTTQSSYNIPYSITDNYQELEKTLYKQRDKLNEDINNLIKYFDLIVSMIRTGGYLTEDKISILNSIKTEAIGNIENNLVKLRKKILDLNISKLKKFKLFELSQENNKKMGELNNQISLQKQSLIEYNLKLLLCLKGKYLNDKYNNAPIILSSEIKSSIQLGQNDYAQISIKEPNLTYKKEQLVNLFPFHVGTNKSQNKLGLSSFSKTDYNLSLINDVKDMLEPFVTFEYTGNLQFVLPQKGTIDYEILLTTIDGTSLPIENITAGSLSKIYINKMFEDNLKDKGKKTIIIYDQPDTNMEKDFILNELVKKIRALKNNYQIFITTHEPLLVINADANNIIQAENNKMISQSINIKYSNISLTDITSKSNAFEKISKLIDGSHNAVKFRSKIYGGMINENRDKR